MNVAPLESRRTVIVRRVIITLLVLACIAGMALAVSHTRRGDDQTTSVSGAAPTLVEFLAPAPESNVLSQAQITIDMVPPYDATLTLNAVPIPVEQLQKRPELNQVTFTPGPGKVVEKLPAGRNCVEAAIFRLDRPSEVVRSTRWCFNVT